ncbi:MAG: hypothetical protein GMKNLPBB_00106 [Myxococcota bacterium]|nr:hypothetical protein [Myxococcota bacterium]
MQGKAGAIICLALISALEGCGPDAHLSGPANPQAAMLASTTPAGRNQPDVPVTPAGVVEAAPATAASVNLDSATSINAADPGAADLVRMIDANRAAFDARPKDFQVRRNIGMLFYQVKRYADAVIYLEEALKDRPAALDVRVTLAACYAVLGMEERALKEYRILLKEEPGNPDFRFMEGRLLLSRGGKYEEEGMRILKELAEQEAGTPAADLAEQLLNASGPMKGTLRDRGVPMITHDMIERMMGNQQARVRTGFD